MKNKLFYRSGATLLLLILSSTGVFAGTGGVPSIGGIQLEFIVFGLTLVGVAFFHKHTCGLP
jgi:hypothetical protein